MPDPADYFAVEDLEGVPSALAAARDGVDALLRDRGLRRTTPSSTAESLLRGAAASASLDGVPTDVEQLRDGSAEPLALGAARLNAGLLALVPTVGTAPLQALARMHALAMAGLVADEALGRPRQAPDVVSQLHALARRLVGPTSAPGVAVAVIAHAEVARLQPFEAGNGLVARALERLVLAARGVDPSSVTVPEGGHQMAAGAYQEALEAYASRSQAGRRSWLLYAAKAVTWGAELSPLR
ncbi:MAG: oxidoreductase [Nocardioidaceae bacterium]